ncbi:expression library immunization antigen 1 [Apiospora hydei]|uniref:Expression library immunization antigen 1 n=1 Tax=Apiospora hydei TaxID=1337664 RepID=A0ABR1X4Z5_9PEZI
MAPLLSVASATLLFLTAARAHFQVQYPPTIGAFDDDKEPTAPCGGYTPDFSKTATDFHVGGDAIATKSGHPQTQWLYRITTDDKAAGNWTQIYGQVQQSGVGTFCVPKVAVPESYIGQKAVLSIVADGDDGMLYQVLLARQLRRRRQRQDPSACTNSSSVTASFNEDPKLAALVGSSTNTTSGGGGSTGSTPSSSSPKSAAAGIYGSLSDVRALLAVGPLAALAMLVL